MIRCIDEENKTIEMVEGDFGITLSIELKTESEETISESDSFVIKIFENTNESAIIEKTYTDIEDKTIRFELTKEESELLKTGVYFYNLDWYNGETFLGNIIASAKFIVKDKAGVESEG